MSEINRKETIHTLKGTDSLSDDARIIVSFTSYPARISFVPEVLESLYVQSKKPDKIVLWLAKEQFPNREKDLPKQLIDDVAAGKLDIRWCDNLGSHKKYFYAMQEFPNDLIIIVDDDVYYHPDAIKTLYNRHIDFPDCIVGLYNKIILIDDENTILPYKKWPFGIYIDYPSMQLMPTGVGGVLYPPNSVDPCIFDKSAILSRCNFNGVICGDDSWLKAHAVLAGTPTVTQECKKITHQPIFEVQRTDSTIGSLDPMGQLQQEQVIQFVLERRGSHSEKTVRELLLEAKAEKPFLDMSSDVVVQNTYLAPIEKLITRIAVEENRDTDESKITKHTLHYYISLFCRAMAYGNEEYSKKYMEEFYRVFCSVPSIDDLSKESIYVRAFVEHSAILRNSISPVFKDPETYLQMLANWKDFFSKHPDCKNEYYDGYISFLSDMKRFSYSEYCGPQEEYGQTCRESANEEWQKIPLNYRIKKRIRNTLGSVKRLFGYRRGK